MRGRQRPGSSHSAASQLRSNAFTSISNPTIASQQPVRRVFNCIVDDTALVAGVKKSTRNGIRQWVKNGQIRLFVPLHALEQLRRLIDNGSRRSEDIQETLQWLDEATSKYPNSVALQGGDETYARWAEVEKFAIPRTLFSETYLEHEQLHDDADSALAAEADAKLGLSGVSLKPTDNSNASQRSTPVSHSPAHSASSNVSLESPPTSPAKAALSPEPSPASLANHSKVLQSSSASCSAVVPTQLQDLFNYILWRIHQELDPVAALESFIFLCNDPDKASVAKGFDVKTKRLEQLRDAVSREDRDFRNRQAVLSRETKTNSTVSALPLQDVADVDDDEEDAEDDNDDGDDEELVVFRPTTPRAPAAMLQKQAPNLIDPHAFGGRGPQPFAPLEQPTITPKSPRSPPTKHTPAFRGSPRGSHALPFAPRGTGRGSARGNFRGNARGRGGGAAANTSSGNPVAPVGQIDPDSYARPEPRGGFNGGRGARKLWVPT